MGLSASQARLLTLTSRKCDIEFYIQHINTKRLQLTYKTSELSTIQSDGLSNRILKFRNSDQSLSDISINSTTGKINSTSTAFYKPDGTKITSIQKGSDNKIYLTGDTVPSGVTLTNYTGTDLDMYLSNAVSSGQLIVSDWTSAASKSSPQVASSSNLENILYTDDDDSVVAQYEAKLAPIQAEDKRLEMDSKNLETQYKAITTELDSVKKIIDDNINKTFKIFANA